MSSSNYVAVKSGTSRYKKDISFIIYTSFDIFEKKWQQDLLNIITRNRLID